MKDQFNRILDEIEEIADNIDKRLDSIKSQEFETIEEKIKREFQEKKGFKA